MKYQVTVVNIGTVHDGDDLTEAIASFAEYYHQSNTGYGRASNEEVTLWVGNEPEVTFNGTDSLVEITDYGVVHVQYFQGHGVSHTRWGESSLGAGCDIAEALDDAVECLAQSVDDGLARDLLVKLIEADPNYAKARRNSSQYSVQEYLNTNDGLTEDGEVPEDCELYYYVGLRYNTDLK
jgi:hypothetical protein